MKMKKIASLMMIGVAALGVLSNNVYAENKDAELISDSAYQESYSKIWGQIDAIDESEIRMQNLFQIQHIKKVTQKFGDRLMQLMKVEDY